MRNIRFILYKITNNVNGKIYIGKHHCKRLDDQYFGSGTRLKSAIKHYGIQNFTFDLLYELHNAEELKLLEKYVVNEEFCKRKDVYNMKVGGDGGSAFGHNVSEYHKNVLRELLSRKDHPIRSKEALQRGSISKRGNHNAIRRSVSQYTKDNKLVRTFDSITEASKHTGIISTGIKNCLQKGYDSTSGGYKWYYNDDLIYFC